MLEASMRLKCACTANRCSNCLFGRVGMSESLLYAKEVDQRRLYGGVKGDTGGRVGFKFYPLKQRNYYWGGV